MLKRLTHFLQREASHQPSAPPPDEYDAQLEPAIAAIRQGRGDTAITCLEALLNAHPGNARAHLLLGTCRHERREIDDARDNYLIAATLEPTWATPHFHLGVLSADIGRHAEAAAAFLRALEIGPPEARVYHALGAAYRQGGDSVAAVEQFRKALALAPDFAQAHSNLGLVLLRDLEQYDEGQQHIERAMALAPADPAVLCNQMMVLQHRGRRDEALTLADTVLARAPALVEARVNRALILLGKGDYSSAWDAYEARRLLDGGDYATGLPCPEWQGERLEGRSILVYPEQGLGDEIMFASCIPDLVARGGRCTLECHPKLERIFRRSFPGVEVLSKNARREAPQGDQRAWDFQVPIGSLPRFMRRTRAEFPAHAGYLCPDPSRVAYWRSRLSGLPGVLKIGLSWRGGLASTRRSLRSIPLDLWRPVLALPGIDFLSLQYSDSEGELEGLRTHGDRVPHHWAEALDDYDETAALVSALDLVISVQTAVVHLAGALGQEVWVLTPEVPEWRYDGDGDSMAWYPAVRLLRQAQRGVWTDVLERVRSDLAARTSGHLK